MLCVLMCSGTPVNRIPIMAKQTLDLYELFRLVVSKGGLVEVINKKLWREITKGLNLPSSITSAAFTLRTQSVPLLPHFRRKKLKLKNWPCAGLTVDSSCEPDWNVTSQFSPKFKDSKSRDTKTGTDIKNPARSNLDISSIRISSHASSHWKWRRR